jgi:hypothetical protein
LNSSASLYLRVSLISSKKLSTPLAIKHNLKRKIY